MAETHVGSRGGNTDAQTALQNRARGTCTKNADRTPHNQRTGRERITLNFTRNRSRMCC